MCRRWNSRPVEQMMSLLPEARVTRTRRTSILVSWYQLFWPTPCEIKAKRCQTIWMRIHLSCYTGYPYRGILRFKHRFLHTSLYEVRQPTWSSYQGLQ